ncbi:MAG TPA: hypothetical protein VGE01_10845 [Fimbriimonas sp.]
MYRNSTGTPGAERVSRQEATYDAPRIAMSTTGANMTTNLTMPSSARMDPLLIF